MDFWSLFLSHQLALSTPRLEATLPLPGVQAWVQLQPGSLEQSLWGFAFPKGTLAQLASSDEEAEDNAGLLEPTQDSSPTPQDLKVAQNLWQTIANSFTEFWFSFINTFASQPAPTNPPAPPAPSLPPEPDLPFPLPEFKNHVVSLDVLRYDLATTDNLEREPQLDPNQFEPATGVQFHEDGSVTIRELVANDQARLTLIGDFNNWGQDDLDLTPYQLQPLPDRPEIHAITLPPGDYHKMQYRFLDQNGSQRLHLSADLFSTPAFNARFDPDRQDGTLNGVLWKPTPLPAETIAPPLDFRGKSLVIAEIDMVSLALKWVCPVADSPFFGQTGADNISQLYRFVGECGLPEKMADLGYNIVEFMPLDTHVDFWEPGASYFPDWRYSYQSINFFGKHADFGSPDELKAMINAFHRAKIGLVLDVVYGHFPNDANLPPREFGPAGFTQYKLEDGSDLYSASWTEWGTRRFRYTPEVRRYLVDAALINILRYGFDGLRIDNVNGVDSEPYGRTLIREISEAMQQYAPQAILIGEGYFGDWYLNHSLSVWGGGLVTTYCDEFYLWFTENILKSRAEIDIWKLDHILKLDWPRTLLYYSGNHDEFANPGNPFQARGRYLVEAIDAGDFHNQKIRSWSALAMFSSSYFLDMFQQWTLQRGNFGSNGPIDWSRLSEPAVVPIVAFQSDLKKFFQGEPAFAPYNIHRYMVHWIDPQNKVVIFERINFATDKRVYIAVNLADQAIKNYQVHTHPEHSAFEIKLDSDRPQYGGQGHNPATVFGADHHVDIYLGSYGVVGLVEQ
jgi:1,4-alpha-glucan branching enzyme